MIKMCDLPRYADADMEEIKKMKEAHTVLNQVTYEPKPLYHGYTDKRLRINVTDNTIDMIDIPQEVKEKFTGGKGYCLRYLWDATNPDTKWNSPENAITMSAGPIAGITQYGGTGKCLVCSISPMTDIPIDSNVGGYFGPFLKFSVKPETLCVQAGWTPKKGEPRVLPIYQSTTFKYDTSEQMARLFDLEDSGYFYTRLQNPTNDAVAAKIAALEGGVAAMLTSSGQAANFYAIFNICQAGDHFVCSSAIYGGTFNLFGVTMKKLGIDVTFVNPDASEEEISAAFKPNTKALFGETISNPSLEVLDIEKFARIAHSHGVPLIVDNTFPTPINCRPFEWGADIVVHSTTKYMDGHATSVGGCIVDSGNFDWDAHAEKFPGLCTPDESYHGLTYTKAFGKGAYITKATAQLMRDLGSIQSPQNSFLLNLGLETLHLRMPQHCRNAQKVAEYLSKNEKVAWVNYCGLPDNKYYSLAQKYMPNGSCGVISFGLKGGRDVSIKFMDSLEFIAIVTHVADARSCVLHPASHTHRQLTDEQLMEAGVRPDLIRLSVGIENADDIIADIEQALNA